MGCGALATSAHLPNCRKNPRINLVCACDKNRDAAEQAKQDFGAQRTETDWNKVVDAPDIDLCILATHTNLRGEFIIPAVQAGKPVYTEKPLAPSVAEMMSIVNVARQTGVPVCVGHNRRSSPAILEMRRLLNKAKIVKDVERGSVQRQSRKLVPEEEQTQMLFRICDDSRSWKDWVFADEEGIMYGEMVHFIDMALWLNQSPPARVFAEGSNRGNFTFIITFQDRSITTMVHTMVGNFDYPKELFELTTNNVTVAMEQHIEIRQFGLSDEPTVQTFPFADPAICAEQGLSAYIKFFESEKKRTRQAGQAPRRLTVNKGHYRHLDRFLDCIEGSAENPCGIESAVSVNKIAMKLLESAKLGIPLVVNPQDWHIPDLLKQ